MAKDQSIYKIFSQVPRRLFSFWSGIWRRAWGGTKGRAKNCGGLLSRSSLELRLAPVPHTGGRGDREKKGDDRGPGFKILGILKTLGVYF